MIDPNTLEKDILIKLRGNLMTNQMQLIQPLEKAINIAFPCNKQILELDSALLLFCRLISVLKFEVRLLKLENERYKKVILALQEKNVYRLQDEIEVSFEKFSEHLAEIDKLLKLISLNSNTIDIAIVEKYNELLHDELRMLFQLLKSYTQYEILFNITPV